MANLTTVDGIQIFFDADTVAVVSHIEPAAGAAVTSVHGVTKGPVNINESANAFLGRIGVAAKFAQLTDPSGAPVWVGGSAASALRAPLPGEYPPAVNTVVFTGPLTLGVQESPNTAIGALNAHGAKF